MLSLRGEICLSKPLRIYPLAIEVSWSCRSPHQEDVGLDQELGVQLFCSSHGDNIDFRPARKSIRRGTSVLHFRVSLLILLL